MPESNPLIIETSNVMRSYITPAGSILALRGVDITLKQGEFVGVIGRSGAGKTTLINLLAGLDKVSEGEIWVRGIPIHSRSEDQLAKWRCNNIGIIYQNFQLMPTLSLLSNVTLPIDFKGKYQISKANERAKKLLDQVGLIDHIHKKPSEVSGGQQQRVAIARALVNDPDLIFADEPTGRLDSVTAMAIFKVFEDLIAHGKTVLMVTHDRTLFSKFSRVIWMEDGLITNSKSAKEKT